MVGFYHVTDKTVNTKIIFGMFIVSRPITGEIQTTRKKTTKHKLITIMARGSFISYLIGFLSQRNKHLRNNCSVRGFLGFPVKLL